MFTLDVLKFMKAMLSTFGLLRMKKRYRVNIPMTQEIQTMGTHITMYVGWN